MIKFDEQVPQHFPDGVYYCLSTYEIDPDFKQNVIVSTTVDGYLRMITSDIKRRTFYVYVLEPKGEVKVPDVSESPRSELTKEVWLYGGVSTKLVGRISIIEKKTKPLVYKNKDGLDVQIYDWIWEIEM